VGAALLLASAGSAAQDGPRPPCAAAPSPAYAEAGGRPAVRVWTGGDWLPPPCTGWNAAPFRALVATAGRFRHAGDAEELLARLGAVSTLIDVRYWSVAEGRWANLITEASALHGPDAVARRPDFTAEELARGEDRYFLQDDNRSTGAVVYRLRVRELSRDGLVAATENVTPLRYLLLPLAGPGDLQSVHFFQRLLPDEWGYYGLARTGTDASGLLEGRTASYVNRAVALFRHLAGIPTDLEPPVAP
jgi:hypothetical protein